MFINWILTECTYRVHWRAQVQEDGEGGCTDINTYIYIICLFCFIFLLHIVFIWIISIRIELRVTRVVVFIWRFLRFWLWTWVTFCMNLDFHSWHIVVVNKHFRHLFFSLISILFCFFWSSWCVSDCRQLCCRGGPFYWEFPPFGLIQVVPQLRPRNTTRERVGVLCSRTITTMEMFSTDISVSGHFFNSKIHTSARLYPLSTCRDIVVFTGKFDKCNTIHILSVWIPAVTLAITPRAMFNNHFFK